MGRDDKPLPEMAVSTDFRRRNGAKLDQPQSKPERNAR